MTIVTIELTEDELGDVIAALERTDDTWRVQALLDRLRFLQGYRARLAARS